MDCEGACEEHKGKVRTVIINFPKKQTKDCWKNMEFNYCDTAIEADRENGFIVLDELGQELLNAGFERALKEATTCEGCETKQALINELVGVLKRTEPFCASATFKIELRKLIIKAEVEGKE